MGWVKEQVRSSNDIFNEIVKERPEWHGIPDDSTTPYEYWSDHLRDYYDVTLRQCDEICERLKQHYNIKKFYYGD